MKSKRTIRHRIDQKTAARKNSRRRRRRPLYRFKAKSSKLPIVQTSQTKPVDKL